MARFLPAQIKAWTNGELLMSEKNKNDSEHFYRGISTDTRSIRSGEIFLALKGERFDGHDFLVEAVKAGASALVIEKSSKAAKVFLDKYEAKEDIPDLLIVEDGLVAYGEIAAGYRSTLLASVIAITGSVGKTTTRRMVSEVISRQVCTHETANNQNNLVGVPLTLLEADDDDDVIVAELGMDRVGEIERLSNISKPDIAILTSIGYSHAEYIGSRKNILKEKTKIICGMKSNGLVLINGQDRSLVNWAKTVESDISIWSISNEKPQEQPENIPSFWAEKLTLTPQSTTFEAHNDLDPETVVNITIPAPGKYLVRAALFALASAYALGLDLKQAAKDCIHFHNTGNRQNIVEIGENIIIDDSYNASPESTISALENLRLLSSDRRSIACLGGIKELGNYEEELHKEIGKFLLDNPVDLLLLVGEEMKWLLEGLQESSAQIERHYFASTDEVIPVILDVLQEGDAVLLKGSRFYEMEKIHEAILQRSKGE